MSLKKISSSSLIILVVCGLCLAGIALNAASSMGTRAPGDMWTVSGTVYMNIDGTDYPVTNAEITINADGSDYSTVANNDGYYSVQVPEGNHNIEITGDGINTLSQGINVYGDMNQDYFPTAIMWTLSGFVYEDGTMNGIAGARISIDGTSHEFSTDGNGHYSFDGPQVDYDLTISKDGYSDKHESLYLDSDMTMDFTLSSDGGGGSGSDGGGSDGGDDGGDEGGFNPADMFDPSSMGSEMQMFMPMILMFCLVMPIAVVIIAIAMLMVFGRLGKIKKEMINLTKTQEERNQKFPQARQPAYQQPPQQPAQAPQEPSVPDYPDYDAPPPPPQ